VNSYRFYGYYKSRTITDDKKSVSCDGTRQMYCRYIVLVNVRLLENFPRWFSHITINTLYNMIDEIYLKKKFQPSIILKVK